MPQTCLAPQYQPSQLVGLAGLQGEAAAEVEELGDAPCAAWTTFVSPWPSISHRMDLGAVLVVHALDLAGDDLRRPRPS